MRDTIKSKNFLSSVGFLCDSKKRNLCGLDVDLVSNLVKSYILYWWHFIHVYFITDQNIIGFSFLETIEGHFPKRKIFRNRVELIINIELGSKGYSFQS